MMDHDYVARCHIRTEIGVDIKAKLITTDKSGDCTIDNISSGGARVITKMPLVIGQEVTLKMTNIGVVSGVIAWVSRNTFGLKFSEDVDSIADLLLSVAIY